MPGQDDSADATRRLDHVVQGRRQGSSSRGWGRLRPFYRTHLGDLRRLALPAAARPRDEGPVGLADIRTLDRKKSSARLSIAQVRRETFDRVLNWPTVRVQLCGRRGSWLASVLRTTDNGQADVTHTTEDFSRMVRSATAATLLELIRSRRAKTGVIGLGYVGLPLAVEFGRAGYSRRRHRSRLAQGERHQRGPVLHRRRAHRARRGAEGGEPAARDHRLRRPAASWTPSTSASRRRCARRRTRTCPTSSRRRRRSRSGCGPGS